MGAGQIGGVATLLDIDFGNVAGFLGTPAQDHEAQYVIHYFSHALIFCMATLIEPHVALTPAICVFGERHKFVSYAGTHTFFEKTGISRMVQHICVHRGYNHTMRWKECSSSNMALMVLESEFSFSQLEPDADYVMNRLRYGLKSHKQFHKPMLNEPCRYYGWGSRRNGYLLPLLIKMHRMDVVLLPMEKCMQIWNYGSQYLCVQQKPCKSNKYGSLCPDDVGSVIECDGYAVGMMISRLVDRPCGVGFVDLTNYNKFLTCGVDDAREVIEHDSFMSFKFSTFDETATRTIVTLPQDLD